MAHDQNDLMELFRAVLLNCRERAGREILVSEGGVEVKGFFGEKSEMTRNGGAILMSIDGLQDLFKNSNIRNYNFRSRTFEISVPGLGDWSYKVKDGSISFRPKRPPRPCIEAVVPAIGNNLARLRSLYDQGGFNIFVACEGEKRAAELMQAMIAERRSLKLPTVAHYAPVTERYRSDIVYSMPQDVDIDNSAEGAKWNIRQVTERQAAEVAVAKSTSAKEANVYIFNLEAHTANHISRWERQIEKFDSQDFSSVIFTVSLQKSEPVGRIGFVSSLGPLLQVGSKFENAPWEIFEEKRKARSASRPSKPKTWHQTTASVAEAYIAREAPRGLISSESLFFHGPIAYAVFYNNPVAAFVDLPDGRTALFTGRNHSLGGTAAGTASSAIGDVEVASRNGNFERFRVDDLRDFITWGNVQLADIPRKCQYSKDEEMRPRGASVDFEKLATWVEDKTARLQSEIEESLKTKVGTFRKASAYRAMAYHAELRNKLSEFFSIDLPLVVDPVEYREIGAEYEKLANQRQRSLEQKKREEVTKAKENDGGITFRL